MSQDQSATEALRLLHSCIEARLKKNEDYRVKLVLDRALAERTRSHLPTVYQLRAQAAVGMQSPAEALASDPPVNADPIVPPSKTAELGDSLQFATGR